MKLFGKTNKISFSVLGISIIAVCILLPGAQTKGTIKDFPSPVVDAPIVNLGLTGGTDYAQAEGAVIRVNVEGKVVYAGSDPVLGQKVEIDCSEGWKVVYGGLNNLRVKSGDYVDVNQAIGQISGKYLHYEVWKDHKLQNNWK